MVNLRVQNLGASLKVLFVNNTDLTIDRRLSYLSEDVVSSASTIRVQSLIGFESLTTSSGQILCIGNIGEEKSEIILTSNSTALGTTYKEVTLNSALQFDHPQDTKVFILDWNRVEFQYSGTATGSKSTLAAYPFGIAPDMSETMYRETTKDQVFYFARFNDTINNRNSDWSDPIYSTGYDDNMVFAIKKRAVDEVGEVIDGNVITHDFLNKSLWAARREYHESPGKRPFRRKFNRVIGTALTGSYRIELPTDVEKPYTAENVYGVRIGTQPNMSYYDKKEWDFDYRGKPHSTLVLPYTHGVSTSIWLDNGRDFPASGSIGVEGTNISYTKVTGSQNSLTITTHGAWDASGGSDVFANQTNGMPWKFTVFADPGGSAYIYFNMPIDTAYVNQNIYLDHYTALPGFDSDADTLDEPQYDMYVDYLKFKIKERKLRGNIPVIRTRTGQVYIADADFQEWQKKLGNALQTEFLETDIRFYPDVPRPGLPE